jgi:hypothetical protein
MSHADRLRKLAALAGSDNPHEAAEAARQACRIIREGKVTIRDAGSEPSPRDDPYARAWGRDPWAASYAPPPPPRRVTPRGPFARRPSVAGADCVACGEEIPPGDAFACAGGYVHGDCVPASERP